MLLEKKWLIYVLEHQKCCSFCPGMMKDENKRVRKNICVFDLVFRSCVRDAAPWRPELWVQLGEDVRRLVVFSESSSSGSHTDACEILLFDLCGSHRS